MKYVLRLIPYHQTKMSGSQSLLTVRREQTDARAVVASGLKSPASRAGIMTPQRLAFPSGGFLDQFNTFRYCFMA